MHRILRNFDRPVDSFGPIIPSAARDLKYILIYLCLTGVLSSCSSTKGMVNAKEGETTKDAASALGVVAGSYTGKTMTPEELQKAAKDIESDEEAQSAINAITAAPKIKYSPATGKRYSGDLEYDPETGVKLLPLEP